MFDAGMTTTAIETEMRQARAQLATQPHRRRHLPACSARSRADPAPGPKTIPPRKRHAMPAATSSAQRPLHLNPDYKK